MELAIPLLALGGMYVISNQPSSSNNNNKNFQQKSNRKEKENFTNMGKSKQNSYLPNTNIPPQNYPVENLSQLVENVYEYSNPNVATDKYFNQNLYQKKEVSGMNVSNNIQNVYSLTGNYLDTKEFKHNNMVPFYGGKIKGQLYQANMGETILDNMAGTGSQTIVKVEQAPLFKPQENMQWAFGAPNMSDFYQSRVNPGMNNANIKPFESERVGPGLNQGYTTEGSGGYNSGMESRNSWLPKTVDELRVSTNPKLEYSLENHEGPAGSVVKNVGILGKVEKYNPDTFFIQTQDRWLTTTGQEKGQALRPVQEVHSTARMNTSQAYAGVAAPAEKNASYAPSHFEKSKRNELPEVDVSHSNAVGRGPCDDANNALKSHTNYVNNRSLMRQPDTMRSSFSNAIGAVIAPVMDIFRPTRKEEYSSNIRVYGTAESRVNHGYVLNPNDVTPTTIRQTTLYSPNFYVGNQVEGGGYMVADQQAITNQRDTTNCSNIGNAATAWGSMNYEAGYNQINNEAKEKLVVNRINQGNTNIYNQQMNVSVGRIDSDRDNTRMWVPTNMPQIPTSKETYGKIHVPQYNDECIGCTRIEPSILNAFKSNPYTHSLTNAV